MTSYLTRSRLIQVWFGAVVLTTVTCIAFGLAMTVGTVVMLLALSVVPPFVVQAMWPGLQPPTAAEVLHSRERPR
jgi:hypothetical protein